MTSGRSSDSFEVLTKFFRKFCNSWGCNSMDAPNLPLRRSAGRRRMNLPVKPK